MVLIRYCLALPLLLLLSTPVMHAQVYPDSPVFRSWRPDSERRDSRNEGLRRQINVFLLEREAANGDPLAQHELGIRLLTGNGVTADTTRSAEWLRRAAAQSLAPAMYNFALLLHNGWGAEWNPFAAYRMFRAAAERGMPEAMHVTGIFFTDNLVLRQNWDSAWAWVDKAARAGYEPAVRARQEMLRRGHIRLSADSSVAQAVVRSEPTEANSLPQTNWTPVLLDFTREPQSASVATATLLDEVLASRLFSAQDTLLLRTLLDQHADSAALDTLKMLVHWGNPEAMALMGRLFAEGRHVPLDDWRAAELYATAVFLESARAPMLLIEMLREAGLSSELSARAWGGDARAQYVWACLKAMDIDTRLSDVQALDLLERAAAQNLPAALTQLGISHATGRWTTADLSAAELLWLRSSALGSQEGRLRLAAAVVLGRSKRADVASALSLLEVAARQGSLLAEVAIAGSYERGIGRTANTGEAVRRYRDCAMRGSMTAWFSLQRMHDEARPQDAEFLLR